MKRLMAAAGLLGVAFIGVVLIGVAGVGVPPANAAPPQDDCSPNGDLHFVCGLHAPEDLVYLPGTHWLIASGMAPKGVGGIFLIDTASKTSQKLNLGVEIGARHDAATYPTCATPPKTASFATHGLSLRRRGQGRYVLYAVGHGGREAIEVFDVDANGAKPALNWIGCVMMPKGTAANSVTSLSDGTIYATVLNRPGTGFQQMFEGQHTGDVYEWKVGSADFTRIPALSLAGDNGITVSPDGSTLYLNASGAQQVVAFSRTHPTRPPRVANLKTLARDKRFAPDNIHWGPNGQLIVAGMRDNEAACGGPPRVMKGHPDLTTCHRGPIVALVDPKTMAIHVLYNGKANPKYTGVATAVVVGDQLWLSSLTGDRVAYVDLPKGQMK